ncbi:hypothetical protein WMY93_003004 [Mugilogobius chulae]|uniref:Uncharacterized protein n=1 Tax=Mugilogobius chulae TaxID=88201 RepID=A0AAW0PV28_9GOBI
MPNKPMQMHLNTSSMMDSTTLEKEFRTLLAQRHSPILDGLPLAFRLQIPAVPHPRFPNPTSDISDEYGSTTSEEFYECCESPLYESLNLEQVNFYSLNALEDKMIAVSESCGNFKEQAATLSDDRTMSSSETLDVSAKGSQSSILEKMDAEDTHTKEKMQEMGKSDATIELQVVKAINQSEINKALNQSDVVEQSSTLRLNPEATEAKRIPVRELKPKRVYSEQSSPAECLQEQRRQDSVPVKWRGGKQRRLQLAKSPRDISSSRKTPQCRFRPV